MLFRSKYSKNQLKKVDKMSENMKIVGKILDKINAIEDKNKQIKVLEQYCRKYKDNSEVVNFCQFDIKFLKEDILKNKIQVDKNGK